MNDNFNLARSIRRHSLTTPDAPAVVCQGQSLSYAALAGTAAHLAHCLQSVGVRRSDDGQLPNVGILASRSADACTALIGAAWAGATYIPIGLKLPEERILTLLSLCNLSAIIVDDEGARLLSERILEACPPTVICLGQRPAVDTPHAAKLIELPAHAPPDLPEPAHVEADDIAYIIFTSGTTGVPKGVMIPAAAARHYITMITSHLGLQPTDRSAGNL